MMIQLEGSDDDYGGDDADAGYVDGDDTAIGDYYAVESDDFYYGGGDDGAGDDDGDELRVLILYQLILKEKLSMIRIYDGNFIAMVTLSRINMMLRVKIIVIIHNNQVKLT